MQARLMSINAVNVSCMFEFILRREAPKYLKI